MLKSDLDNYLFNYLIQVQSGEKWEVTRCCYSVTKGEYGNYAEDG